jgi:hypothetical protein
MRTGLRRNDENQKKIQFADEEKIGVAWKLENMPLNVAWSSSTIGDR